MEISFDSVNKKYTNLYSLEYPEKRDSSTGNEFMNRHIAAIKEDIALTIDAAIHNCIDKKIAFDVSDWVVHNETAFLKLKDIIVNGSENVDGFF